MDQECLEMVQSCLITDPEKRLSINEVMESKFFENTDWQKVKSRTFESNEIPYKPNPMKFMYLLGNKYDDIQITLKKA